MDTRKTLRINKELHDKIKKEARLKKWSLKVIVEEIINKYFN